MKKYICKIPFFFYSTHREPKLKRKLIRNLIKEVNATVPYILKFKLFGKKHDLKLVFSKDKSLLEQFPSKVALNRYPWMVLIIECYLPNRNIKDFEYNGEKHNVVVSNYSILREFCFIIETLLVAINIAYLGSVSIDMHDKFIIEVDNKRIDWQLKFEGLFFEIISYKFKSSRWPYLRNIPLAQVWRWFCDQEDTLKGISKTSFGRAINSIKYISTEKDYTNAGFMNNLIWSIVGLEALYLKGLQHDRSKTKELRLRIISLLGKIPTNLSITERNLEVLYDYRSRLLHGEANFPVPNFPDHFAMIDKTTMYDKFFMETERTATILGAILISTIKLLILKKWNDLNFNVKYSPTEK